MDILKNKLDQILKNISSEGIEGSKVDKKTLIEGLERDKISVHDIISSQEAYRRFQCKNLSLAYRIGHDLNSREESVLDHGIKMGYISSQEISSQQSSKSTLENREYNVSKILAYLEGQESIPFFDIEEYGQIEMPITEDTTYSTIFDHFLPNYVLAEDLESYYNEEE